jgi:hypothetical protein
MKAKLLKKLREIGRSQITIQSVTTTTAWGEEFATSMSYSYNDDDYRGLFYFGDTVDEVRDRAMKIYFQKNMDSIREKYKKYSRKNINS